MTDASATAEYSLRGYARVITSILEAGYEPIQFEAVGVAAPYSRKILFRHDIDADMGAAERMAKLEGELGVKATYFVMTRSPAYNLFARHNHRLVEQILSYGHSLGLHYDRGFSPRAEMTHDECLEAEAAFLEKIFGVQIDAVSFHQPDPDVVAGRVMSGRFLNTYDKSALHAFRYFSDSNRTLKLSFRRWQGPLGAPSLDELGGANLQVLTHPMWWIYEAQTTAEVWDQVIVNNFDRCQQQFLATERAYGSERVIRLSPTDLDPSKSSSY